MNRVNHAASSKMSDRETIRRIIIGSENAIETLSKVNALRFAQMLLGGPAAIVQTDMKALYSLQVPSRRWPRWITEPRGGKNDVTVRVRAFARQTSAVPTAVIVVLVVLGLLAIAVCIALLK
jgi:hypothetical protein